MKPSLVYCFKLLLLLAVAGVTMHVPDADVLSSLGALRLDGHFTFHDVSTMARDFGNRCSMLPAAVLHPGSVSDIAATVRHVFLLGERSPLTVAARGHGHSLLGQSQAAGGIIVSMESLQGATTQVHDDGTSPYVDAPGGELWINVLRETLKYGLAPKSWTDYLHLTVGGTLSNAGVSGQTFRHGPQVSNVHQLEIVTGRGDVLTCSPEENSDLFYAALGGLGQFGIITRAKIALEPAPKMVRWMRVLYSDFASFTEDQEMLIMAENTFDYIEGFVIINRTGILNNWRTSFKPQDPVQASHFQSNGRVLYCLELTKNFNHDEADILRGEAEGTRPLGSATPLVESSSSKEHNTQICKGSLWKDPDEEIFYLVGFLSSAPSLSGHGSVEHAMNLNNHIVEFCEEADIGMKQYLAPYTTQQQWKAHFGARWETFERRKQTYDPLAILTPGQRIFPKASLSLSL